MTWYASTWGNQHSCRTAKTSISTSLLILPWFLVVLLFLLLFFYGSLGRPRLGGHRWIPAWECCSSFCVYLFGLTDSLQAWRALCALFLLESRPAPSSLRKQTSPDPRLKELKINWRVVFVALALCFSPILRGLFLFSFLYHLCWGRNKSKWHKQTPHKVWFLNLIVL